MMRRSYFLIGLILVIASSQVQCGEDNWEYEVEGSASVPGDDEDMMDGSGSGDTETENDITKLRGIFPENEPEVDGGTSTTIATTTEIQTSETNDEEIIVEEDDFDVKDPTAVNSASIFQSTHFVIALIVGGCVGLLFAICVIMLLAYRMRKKDEGSYALDEQKKPASPSAYQYTQGQEYYA